MAGHGRAQQVRMDKMAARKPFTSGNVSAVEGAAYSTGRMPAEHAATYYAAADAGTITYTVLSYGTPIGYVLASGEVIVPPVKYSRSTTQQQAEVRRAL